MQQRSTAWLLSYSGYRNRYNRRRRVQLGAANKDRGGDGVTSMWCSARVYSSRTTLRDGKELGSSPEGNWARKSRSGCPSSRTFQLPLFGRVALTTVSSDPQNRSKRSPRLGVTAAAARRVVLRPAGAEGTIRAQSALSTKKAPGAAPHAPRRPQRPRAT